MDSQTKTPKSCQRVIELAGKAISPSPKPEENTTNSFLSPLMKTTPKCSKSSGSPLLIKINTDSPCSPCDPFPLDPLKEEKGDPMADEEIYLYGPSRKICLPHSGSNEPFSNSAMVESEEFFFSEDENANELCPAVDELRATFSEDDHADGPALLDELQESSIDDDIYLNDSETEVLKIFSY